MLPPPLGDSQEPALRPAPLLRRTFSLAGAVRSARLYVCGLGFHEVALNGARVGEDVLEPTFTAYDRRTHYVVYDVTASLRPGSNAVGVMLGRGWFDDGTPTPWWFAQASWRARCRLLLQLEAELEDGRRVTVATDSRWRTAEGPVVADGIRRGERYDARLEQPGWDAPDFDDRGWAPAHVVPGPGGRLIAQEVAVRVMETLRPRSIRPLRPGAVLADFGVNIAGRVALDVEGPRGTEVTIRLGERLDEAGDLDQSWIERYADPMTFQRDQYVLRGGGRETWAPRFAYHGFQYAEVTGYPGEAGPDCLRAHVIHSALPVTARFISSDQTLNAVWEASRRSYLGGYVGVPADAPHREKNPWLADILLAAELGLLAFGSGVALDAWLDSVRDAQRPNGQLPAVVPTGGWGYELPPNDDVLGPVGDSICIQLPWAIWRYTGDRSVLERHYPTMSRYVAYLAGLAEEDLIHGGIGDWCPPGGPEAHATPFVLTSTAYYHADVRMVARVARLLGRSREATRLERLADRIRRAINAACFDAATGWYAGREMTSQGVALATGLVADEDRDAVVARLLDAVREHDAHAAFGVVGARWVPQILADEGHADLVHRMATQPTFPGWGHWIAQGATTLWERWEGVDSRNHKMFGDIGAWMLRGLAGLQPDDERPGFSRTIVRPNLIAALDWVEGVHESPYGTVACAWRRTGASVSIDVEIPPNADALIHLPTGDPAAVRESGRRLAEADTIRAHGVDRGRLVLRVGSGSYRFAVSPRPAA